MEFELIDFGLSSIEKEDDEINFYTAFEDFAALRDALEERKIEVAKAELIRIHTHTKKLADDEVDEVVALFEKLEEDDDSE